MSELSRQAGTTGTTETGFGVLRELMDKCTREREFITGKLAWHAPDGYTFAVTGSFFVNYDNSDTDDLPTPTQSWESFLADHGQLFEKYLEEADGDEDEALRLFDQEEGDYLGNFGPYIHEFNGEWLIEDYDSDGLPVFEVRGPVEASVEEVVRFFEASEELDIEQPKYFEGANHEVYWSQGYVKIAQEGASVGLRQREDNKDHGIYVPNAPTESSIIRPVAGKGVTSEDLARYYSCGGRNQITEEQKLGMIRENRRKGTPLWDDPLRNFILPRIVIIESESSKKKKEEVEDFPF